MNRERPDWDTWAIEIAHVVARRSTCFRASVGAVVLDAQHRIVFDVLPLADRLGVEMVQLKSSAFPSR